MSLLTKNYFNLLLIQCLILRVGFVPFVSAETPDNKYKKFSITGNYLAGQHAQFKGEHSLAADFMLSILSKIRQSADLTRKTFLLLIREGRFDEAINLTKTFKKDDNEMGLTKLVLLVKKIKRKEFKSALKELNKAPEDGFSEVTFPLLKAWTLLGQDKVDEAVKHLEGYKGRQSVSLLYKLHQALIYSAGDQNQQALKILESLLNDNQTLDFRLVQLAGNIYEITDQPNKAISLFKKFSKKTKNDLLLNAAKKRQRTGKIPSALIVNPNDGIAEAFFGIANSFKGQKAYEMALIFGRFGLYIKPKFPVMLILIGELLEMRNRLIDANQLYSKVQNDSPFRKESKLRIASNLHSLKKTDEAIILLRKLASAHPNDPEPLIQVGDYLRSKERYAEAIIEYNEAMRRTGELKAHNWRLLYIRGVALEREKMWKKAEKDFLRALDFKPNQPYVLNYLGYSYLEQKTNLNEALEMIRKAVKLRPRDGYIIDSLGWGYYRLKKYEAAVLELERAVLYRPEDPIINDHLGDAYWKVGRKIEARFQWQRSLSLEPKPELLKSVKNKLQHGLRD